MSPDLSTRQVGLPGKHMEGSTIKRRMEEPNPDSNNLDVPKRKENLKARLTPSTAYPNWARVGHYLLLMLLVMRHMRAPLTVEVEHGKNLTDGELDTLRYRGPEAMVEAAEPQLKENMHRKRLTGGELDTLLSRGVGTLQSEPLRGRPGNNPLSRSPDTLWHLQMGRTMRKLMNQAYQSITSTSGRFKCAEFWDKGFSSGGTNLGTRCCWEKDRSTQVGDSHDRRAHRGGGVPGDSRQRGKGQQGQAGQGDDHGRQEGQQISQPVRWACPEAGTSR